MLVRPQEQPRYVQDGLIDVGFTGYDWIMEDGADDVVEVMDMVGSKVSRRLHALGARRAGRVAAADDVATSRASASPPSSST